MTQLINCPSCGSPVPLSDQSPVACVFCEASVVLPPELLEVAQQRQSAMVSRAAAEEAIAALSRGGGAGARRWAFALTVGLPLCASLIGNAQVPPLTGLFLLSLAMLPALVPGALTFAYVATARDVRQSYLAALSARWVRGHQCCRNCGGPLAASERELAATCLYCGTDNLLGVDAEEISAYAGGVSRTLGEALAELRIRLRLLWVSLLVTALGVLGLGVGVHWVGTLAQ